MPNLRILYDNAIFRSTLTASSTQGTMVVDNLKQPKKSSIWRSAGTVEKITVIFPVTEFIQMVSFPFCNFSSSATIRVRGYSEPGDVTPNLDTGVKQVNPPLPFGQLDWGLQPLAANAFSYGGGTYATLWTTLSAVKKLEIDISDAPNPSGYLEAAILVAGRHWSAKYNPDYGMQLLMQDNSKHERTESGDLLTERSTKHRKLTFNMSNMPPADRDEMLDIIRGNGKTKPLFVSAFPESLDTEQEQRYQMYGKLSTTSPLNHPAYNTYATSIDLEEV